MTVLLIACPCALVLSTPAAIATGIATAARYGILIKSDAALEMLAHIKTAAFDKTGTLTMGHPKVTDVIGDRSRLLSLAASAEAGLTHPIARAIVAAAMADNLALAEARDVRIRQGAGIEAIIDTQKIEILSPSKAGVAAQHLLNDVERLELEGKSIAVLLENGVALGLIACRDEARADAKPAMQALKAMGIKLLMLSGDNQNTANAIAAPLGMSAEGSLMPADKLKRIADLKAVAPVLMVGDGVNDAPALATASLGLAMGGGTDVAIETADVGLLKDRLTGVPDAILLARKSRNVILQNITLAIGLKVVFLVLTVFGKTTLWTAIIADTGATILVTLNALLLFWTFRPMEDQNR